MVNENFQKIVPTAKQVTATEVTVFLFEGNRVHMQLKIGMVLTAKAVEGIRQAKTVTVNNEQSMRRTCGESRYNIPHTLMTLEFPNLLLRAGATKMMTLIGMIAARTIRELVDLVICSPCKYRYDNKYRLIDPQHPVSPVPSLINITPIRVFLCSRCLSFFYSY